MKKGEPGYTIGLYTMDNSINQYVEGNLAVAVQSLQDDDSFEGCDAIFCFDVTEERLDLLHQKALEANQAGLQVIWHVEHIDEDKLRKIEEELQTAGVTVHKKDLEDAGQIVDLLTEFYESSVPPAKEPEGKRSKPKAKAQPQKAAFIEDDDIDGFEGSPLDVGLMSSVKQFFNRSQQANELPEVLENVIAVAGYPGCGSSFVAWNVAVALERQVVLVEGRSTGSLAKWLQVNQDRQQFFTDNIAAPLYENVEAALSADSSISTEDLKKMDELPRLLVIDCGDQWESEVYKRAGKRIFVRTPDPQYAAAGRPTIDPHVQVLNQYPEDLSLSVKEFEKRFGVEFHLVVPARPRQATLSLWSRRAWIVTEQEHKQKWTQVLSI